MALLLGVQEELGRGFDDFRRAFERRDEAAYRLAISDFHDRLQRWTEAEERALLPALARTAIAGRDPKRELSLEYVQLRELTRHVRMQIESRGRLSDILGFIENLARRFEAHQRENRTVYYPAAASVLTAAERLTLAEAAARP